MQHDDASEACAALIDESARRWQDAEGNYRDDITAIVCHFPLFPTGSFKANAPRNSTTVRPDELPDVAAGKASPVRTGSAAPDAPLPPAGAAAASPGADKFERRRLSVESEYEEGSVSAQRMEELRRKYGGATGGA